MKRQVFLMFFAFCTVFLMTGCVLRYTHTEHTECVGSDFFFDEETGICGKVTGFGLAGCTNDDLGEKLARCEENNPITIPSGNIVDFCVSTFNNSNVSSTTFEQELSLEKVNRCVLDMAIITGNNSLCDYFDGISLEKVNRCVLDVAIITGNNSLCDYFDGREFEVCYAHVEELS